MEPESNPHSSDLFHAADGRLRSGWRFVIFVLSYMLVSAALLWLWPRPENFIGAMFRSVGARIAVTLGISWAMLRWLEHKPLAEVGIGRALGWSRLLGFGVLLGIALVATTAAILVAASGVHFERLAATGTNTFAQAPAIEFLAWTPFIFFAAASEELLIRGYPFRLLVEGGGAPIAVAATSLVFGLLHAMNPDASVFSVVNTVLAGVMLALACLRARSLWHAIGLHFSWNWALAAFGFPVSGLELPGVGWRAVLPAAATWLHGGAYGPEAGAVVTAILVIACLLIWFQPALVGCLPLPGGSEHSAANFQETSYGDGAKKIAE